MLLPGMLYAASVWIKPQRTIPGQKKTYGSVGIICRLSRVHRQACIMITGALHSTPTDSMEAHLNIALFHLIVDLLIMREATQLCTLPSTHPLYCHVQKATRWVKRHQSPLHEILATYKLNPMEVETIEAIQHPPGWRPPCKISITCTKDEATEEEKEWERKGDWRVYTDSSDIDGEVGAAAVLFPPHGEPKTLQYYLGPSTHHSVYEAEVIGLALGIELL